MNSKNSNGSTTLQKQVGDLMSHEERAVCRQLSGHDSPHNQRALALLALDQGDTVEEAAVKGGLSEEQVRYWLGRFRTTRLGIFPEELLAGLSIESISAGGTAKAQSIETNMIQDDVVAEVPADPEETAGETPLASIQSDAGKEKAKKVTKPKKKRKSKKDKRKKARKKSGKKSGKPKKAKKKKMKAKKAKKGKGK